jgi:hypothetical protein
LDGSSSTGSRMDLDTEDDDTLVTGMDLDDKPSVQVITLLYSTDR